MGDLSQHVEYNLIELNEIPIKQSEKIQIINPYFIISTYENLEKYMKDNKISYVIIDDSLNNRFPMFEHIFYYEKEYPNLEKVFDSKNEFNFLKVKIFKINLKEK